MRDESRVPLFRIDPGWPFVIAGLLLLAAGILIPGHRELLELKGELLRQETREQAAFEQLRAYDEFLAGVRESSPEIVRRLAMAHLNKIPAGEDSLLLTPGMNQTVGEWIESSIPDRTVVVPPYPDTVLARWALGPGRLWMLGVAVMLLFVGFVAGPSTPSIPALSAIASWRRPVRGEVLAASEPVAVVAPGNEELPQGFDLVETKSFPSDATEGADGEATGLDLRADELELWQASDTRGEWSSAEYVGLLPPAESVASCDDVGLAFLDESDGSLEPASPRGAD